ncbi:hypothetical protein HMPREF9057_02566 [Actinomyces sp. oral taxon 171 str. F0337]|nr:hypothetical protein HMPREF9057_02566 [Actinomyces sp. oral taxon 171 str. F0337]
MRRAGVGRAEAAGCLGLEETGRSDSAPPCVNAHQALHSNRSKRSTRKQWTNSSVGVRHDRDD